MESALMSFTQNDVRKSKDTAMPMMMSYQNMTTSDELQNFKPLKMNQASFVLTPSSNQKFMKSTVFSSSDENSIFSPI